MKSIANILAAVLVCLISFSFNLQAHTVKIDNDIELQINQSTYDTEVYTLSIVGIKEATKVNVVMQDRKGDIIFVRDMTIYSSSDEIDVMTSGCGVGTYTIIVTAANFEIRKQLEVERKI